jgi:hypothetical protein
MNLLNKAQRLALKKVFDRTPLRRERVAQVQAASYGLRSMPGAWWANNPRPCCQYHGAVGSNGAPCWNHHEQAKPLSYLAFRRSVFVGRDCAMVPWCNMWLGIEPDGYTHS